MEGEFDLTGAVIVAETGLIRGPIKADVYHKREKISTPNTFLIL